MASKKQDWLINEVVKLGYPLSFNYSLVRTRRPPGARCLGAVSRILWKYLILEKSLKQPDLSSIKIYEHYE